MALYVFLIGGCLAVVAWVVREIFRSGFFRTVQPTVTEEPKYLSSSLTVYYKYLVGPYDKAGAVIKEGQSILPSGSTSFGIYYDSPDDTAPELLQAAVGVVFGVDGKDLYTENYATQLTRLGYEKMVLPKVKRAIQAVHPATGILSFFCFLTNVYPAAKTFIEKNRLEVEYSVEVYDSQNYYLFFPLDGCSELNVAEYKTKEQLETDLARKNFDSEFSDSQSESEYEEDERERAEAEAIAQQD